MSRGPLRTASSERPPAVAGSFYPFSRTILTEQVDELLAQEAGPAIEDDLVGLVVPHAGYVYSGPVAASAYARLRGRTCDSVILLGPSHHYRFDGAALYARGSFRTPLGRVPVDETLAMELIGQDDMIRDAPDVHAPEHCLEVQLPFLQRVLGEFSILPIVMYDFSPDNCARLGEALARIVEGRNILLLITTDLAHYPAYDDAVESDTAMIEAIASLDPREVYERSDEFLSRGIRNLSVTMCGTGPVITGIDVAKRLGADRFETFKYMNSGDVAGAGKGRVVGYVGGAFLRPHEETGSGGSSEGRERIHVEKDRSTASTDSLDRETQRAVLKLARETIVHYVNGRELPTLAELGFSEDVRAALAERRGVFVTLKGGGALRGCIGHIIGDRPLAELIPQMAIAAATQDPRFPPVTRDEIDLLEIEVSVLTPPRPVKNLDEIEVGRHGLIVRQGPQSGLLLPQVAVEQGWNRDQFLGYTCLKAGLPPDAWRHAGTRIESFEADVFGEADFRNGDVTR